MIIPIVPIIFTDPSSPAFLLHGYSQTGQYVIAGLVTALFGLMQFIAAPFLGELSDAYGRKRLLTLGVGILALSQILFGFGIQIGSVFIILFSRAIAGLAGANFSIAQAAIADVSDAKDRAKNFGLIGAAFGIGFILGPVISGWLASFAHSAAAPFWFAGGLGTINLMFITLMFPETRKVTHEQAHSFTVLKGIYNVRSALQDVDARPVYTASFLYMAGFSFMTSFMGVLLVNRFNFTESDIGTYFGAVGAWVVFTQLVVLRILSKHYKEKNILRYSMLIIATAQFVYPFLPTPTSLYIIMPFIAVPQGLSMVNLQSLVSKSVSPQKQGAALGINGSLLAFATGVIPLIAGFGSGLIGITTPFIAGALFIIAGWSALFVFPKRAQPGH